MSNSHRNNVITIYEVPLPRHDAGFEHDTALFSLWNHFVEFCQNNFYETYSDTYPAEDSQCFLNKYSNKYRLEVFIQLSNGESPTTSSISSPTKSIN